MRANCSERFREFLRRLEGRACLLQDPTNREIVYAGTTEGSTRLIDGGKNFNRMTGPDVIVNDVYVDPSNPQRVLLATDRSGILLSTDGGATFAPSNEGFSERKVEALLVDHADPVADLCRRRE